MRFSGAYRTVFVGWTTMFIACGGRTGFLIEDRPDTGVEASVVDATRAETSEPLVACATRRFPVPAIDPGPLVWEACGVGCRRNVPTWALGRHRTLLIGPYEWIRRVGDQVYLQYQRWTPSVEPPYPPERMVTVIEPLDQAPIFAIESVIPMYPVIHPQCGVHASVGGHGVVAVTQGEPPLAVEYLALSWAELAAGAPPRSRVVAPSPLAADGFWPVTVGERHAFIASGLKTIPLATDSLLPTLAPGSLAASTIHAHAHFDDAFATNGDNVLLRISASGETVVVAHTRPGMLLRGWALDRKRGTLVWVEGNDIDVELFAATLPVSTGGLVPRRIATLRDETRREGIGLTVDDGLVLHLQNYNQWVVTDLDTGKQTVSVLPPEQGRLREALWIGRSEAWFVGDDPRVGSAEPDARYFYRLAR